eukprot:UN27295
MFFIFMEETEFFETNSFFSCLFLIYKNIKNRTKLMHCRQNFIIIIFYLF